MYMRINNHVLKPFLSENLQKMYLIVAGPFLDLCLTRSLAAWRSER